MPKMFSLFMLSILLYPSFITQDTVIKLAEVAEGTEEKRQMCRYTGLLLARKRIWIR
jgi:hypothetical protein